MTVLNRIVKLAVEVCFFDVFWVEGEVCQEVLAL